MTAERPTTTRDGSRRVLGPLTAIGAVWEYLLRVWWHIALSDVLRTLTAPVLTLLAMGLGLGTLVDRGGSDALGGATYLQFVAPALLCALGVQSAVTQAAYPVFSRFKWMPVWFGVIAAPVAPWQITAGVLLSLTTTIGMHTLLFWFVLLLLGVGGGAAGLLMIPIGVLTALACGVWVLVLVSSVTSDGSAINVLFRFVLVPMTLFSGSFFPVDTLPGLFRVLAWISPLWHGNEAARIVAGTPGAGSMLWLHLTYLVVFLAVGAVVAGHRFARKLVR